MKVLAINNDGGGFADWIEIEEGTTVETLSVWTEPIVLEEIDLGAFEIRLELKGGDALPGYRVITEDDGWSASRGITHPHV